MVISLPLCIHSITGVPFAPGFAAVNVTAAASEASPVSLGIYQSQISNQEPMVRPQSALAEELPRG